MNANPGKLQFLSYISKGNLGYGHDLIFSNLWYFQMQGISLVQVLSIAEITQLEADDSFCDTV